MNKLITGDCLEVMATLPDNSVDAVITDPPYGLAENTSRQSISNRVYDALFKIGFPDLYETHIKFFQGGDLPDVPVNGSALGSKDGAVGIDSGISVPEGSVDFHNGIVSDQEVNDGNIPSRLGVTNGDLPCKGDVLPGQFLGDFILKFRNMDALRISGDVPDGCLADAFFGGFAVPIIANLASGLPSSSDGGLSIIFGDHHIRCCDDSLSQPKSSPFIMTFPRTVNTLMLRFDLSGRPIELLPTSRADHLATIGNFEGTELIRAFPATSGLSAISQPARVRFVVPSTDGAFSLYWFHLWTPKKVVTDRIIPQGGFMGKSWDATLPNPAVWRQALRVLKPGGHMLAFSGTRTYHRMACAIEDAGFEIRDMVEWIYGSGFPKSLNIGKAVDKLQGNEREVVGENRNVKGRKIRNIETLNVGAGVGNNTELTRGGSPYEGWHTALKPAHEPICLARKPLSEKNVAENVLKWGTGGINVDACRVEHNGEKLNGGGGIRDNYKGWGKSMCAKTDSAKSESLGRFPANLIHDGSDEVKACFPESKSTGGTGEKSKGKMGTLNWEGQATGGFGDSGNASRFFKSIIYTAKASKSDRGEGNIHATVKPTALMEYLITMIAPAHATVLDPFTGSGTTGVACVRLNRNFIGIEREPEYVAIAQVRIAKAARKLHLLPEE